MKGRKGPVPGLAFFPVREKSVNSIFSQGNLKKISQGVYFCQKKVIINTSIN